MNNIKSDTIKILNNLNIQKSDTILVHSNIAVFNITENISRKQILHEFYQGFMETVGNDGTLCVPAYYYEYARMGIPYDNILSPVSKELGSFAKYINSLDESKRSFNPLTAICSIGKNSKYICKYDNIHSYGEDSAYDKLYKLNTKIILFGVDFNVLTFDHYIENQVGVPYTYDKLYNIPIFSNNTLVSSTSYANVRYLNYNIIYKQLNGINYEHIKKAYSNGSIKDTEYKGIKIYAVETKKYYECVKQILYKDRYYFLVDIPNFPSGQVPNDGPVMKK